MVIYLSSFFSNLVSQSPLLWDCYISTDLTLYYFIAGQFHLHSSHFLSFSLFIQFVSNECLKISCRHNYVPLLPALWINPFRQLFIIISSRVISFFGFSSWIIMGYVIINISSVTIQRASVMHQHHGEKPQVSENVLLQVRMQATYQSDFLSTRSTP